MEAWTITVTNSSSAPPNLGIPTEGPEIAGEPVVSLCAPSVRAQATRLHACITHLIVKEQGNRFVRQTSDLSGSCRQGGILRGDQRQTRSQGFRWSVEAHRVPDSVLVDTVSRFKGLESAIVFLWGLQELQPDIDRESLYVGLSRAKSRLYLMGTEQICRTLLA